MHLKKIKVSEPMDGDMPKMASYPPSFGVDSKQMPEITDWEVGAKYQLIIEVEQKSKSENENGLDARFDIIAYKYLPKKSIDEMSDAEFEKYKSESLNKGELI